MPFVFLKMRRLNQKEKLVDRMNIHRLKHIQIHPEPQGGKAIQGFVSGNDIGMLQQTICTSDMIHQVALAVCKKQGACFLLMGDDLRNHGGKPPDDLLLALSE